MIGVFFVQKIFKIKIDKNEKLNVIENLENMNVEDATINWILDDNQEYLKEIEIIISGLELDINSEGVIKADNSELNERVYRIAAYLSNSILIQTGIDAINYEAVLNYSPEIVGETSKEEKEIRSRGVRKHSSFPASLTVTLPMDPNDYPGEFENSKAIALYADAFRVDSLFQEYEILYKIIEYFFPGLTGNNLDKNICDYVKNYDSVYRDKNEFTQLRRLRNRCVHSGDNKHANPEDLTSVKEVSKKIKKIRNLAKMLIEHPPT